MKTQEGPARPTESVAPPAPPAARAVEFRMPRWVFALVLLTLVVPWGVAGYLLGMPRVRLFFDRHAHLPRRSDAGAAVARVFMADPGPWGEIELTRMDIEPPDPFVKVPDQQAPTTWHFTGYTPERLEALIRSLGLKSDEQAKLLNRSSWVSTDTEIAMVPGDRFIEGIGAAPRERLYAALAAAGGNPSHEKPFYFNPNFLDERFENCNLTPETIHTIRRMIYPRGNVMLFADLTAALNLTPDPGERLRMIKTLSRKTALVGRLLVTPTTDVRSLVDYWGAAGRAKDIEPLLTSLARVPGGCAIDIVHLMSQFARQRIYTYPYPSEDQIVSREDCHWTALNFFLPTPDPDLTDAQHVMQRIQQDYYPLPGDPRYGDVMFFMKPSGEVAHSAVYIAEQVVFTKNGATPDQPWILMSLPYLHDCYNAFQPTNQPLQIVYYRKKDR